ncbi:DNA-binding response regulator, partial [Pseudoalteromonas piscicida]
MSSKNQPNTMTKMRVLFADDELPAREKLSHQLSLMEH